MLVRDWMTSDVKTINSDAGIQDAINMMIELGVKMLPVMESDKLVGILTDRDVKHACPSDASLLDFQSIMYQVSRIQVSQIMTPNPITLHPDLTIEEAAEILLQNNISGGPVIDDAGKLIGIVVTDDLFRAMIALTGLKRKGVAFGFQAPDKAGSIKEVTDVIRKNGGRLVSIATTYETAPEGFRNVYVRAFGMTIDTICQLENELRDKAKFLYVVDNETNQRKIFG
jgi:acetoin utilization protein AcuB